jgi:hypothetical protein
VRAVSEPALAPAAALAWLGSLSIDLRGTAVLDAAGAVLAGDPEVARRAAAAFASAPGATEVDQGDLLAVRHGGRVVAAVVGRHALRQVLRADLADAARAVAAHGA